MGRAGREGVPGRGSESKNLEWHCISSVVVLSNWWRRNCPFTLDFACTFPNTCHGKPALPPSKQKPLQVPCPVFNQIVCLPGVESCEFFVYFGDETFVRGIIGKYIFPYSWFPFHFADVFCSHGRWGVGRARESNEGKMGTTVIQQQ